MNPPEGGQVIELRTPNFEVTSLLEIPFWIFCGSVFPYWSDHFFFLSFE